MQFFQGFATELPCEEWFHIGGKPWITLSDSIIGITFTDNMFESFVTILVTLFAALTSTSPFACLACQVVRRENVSGKQLSSILVFGGQCYARGWYSVVKIVYFIVGAKFCLFKSAVLDCIHNVLVKCFVGMFKCIIWAFLILFQFNIVFDVIGLLGTRN